MRLAVNLGSGGRSVLTLTLENCAPSEKKKEFERFDLIKGYI